MRPPRSKFVKPIVPPGKTGAVVASAWTPTASVKENLLKVGLCATPNDPAPAPSQVDAAEVFGKSHPLLYLLCATALTDYLSTPADLAL